MPEREWFEKDYYQVLGVAPNASNKEITLAYRALAKELHPDTNPVGQERFKEVSAAYDALSNPTQRAEYDKVRRLQAMSATDVGDIGDLGDLFGGLFGGRRIRAQRGGDLETALHLGFTDAVAGATTSVSLPTENLCRNCAGHGAAPEGLLTCERCVGRGVLNDAPGPFSLSSVCPACAGRGSRITAPCANCRGGGRELSSRSVSVRVPPGVEDGQRIRLKGKGTPGTGGAPAGDLLVEVHVAPDVTFSRRGRHVTTTLDISVIQAMLGTQIDVPTLDDPVTLKIPAGTAPGTTMRVKGRGVPAHGRHSQGDLLVRVNVTMPQKLTKKQRTLVEELARSLKEEVIGE